MSTMTMVCNISIALQDGFKCIISAQPATDDPTVLAVQQHMAQQAVFSQIPDVVKAVGILSFCFSSTLMISTSSLRTSTKLF